jgi:thioredoxin reductase (NADPH)
VDLVAAEPKISIVRNIALDAVLGGKMVEKIRIRGTQDNQTREMACAGVFVNIGLTPNSDFLPADVKRDQHGGRRDRRRAETSVKGIWAVGAVRSGYSGLSQGCGGGGGARGEGRERAAGKGVTGTA